MKGKTMHYLEVEFINGRYIFFDQDGDSYDWNGRELTEKDIHEIKYCIRQKRCIRLVTKDSDGTLERFGTADYKYFDRSNAKKTKDLPYLKYVDLDTENPTLTVTPSATTIEEKTPVTAK